MKTIQISKFGSKENLNVVDVEKPKVQPGTVLVKVKAIGLNPIDIKTRNGVGLLQEDSLPLVLGWDVSGIVVEANSDDKEFKVGDNVFGMLAFPKVANAYSEYVLASTDDILHKPESISFTEAAALPLVSLTAWQGLFEHGNLQPGESVLVHAGSGGVGHVAVQLAKLHGANVYTTASAGKHKWLNDLGIINCIDYKTRDFTVDLKDMDLVFDLVGGDNLFDSLTTIKPETGRLITTDPHPYVSQELLDKAKSQDIKANGILVHIDKQQLATITELVDYGKIKIVVDKVFSFDEMRDAHAYLEQGHVKGKVVVSLE